MKEGLHIKLGAVVLALLTVAAVVFAILNFQQRRQFQTPDDGVSWEDSAAGVRAWAVAPDSPAARAGVEPGDVLKAIDGTPVRRAVDVTKRLFRLGPWQRVRYQLERQGQPFETALVTVPADTSASIENYLRLVGLLYLFIGMFIFVRRWNAPRAVHFYIFCLVSFIFYTFHYSGKLNEFDWTIYWGNVVALLLQPALLVHFALVFPERRQRLLPKLAAVYAVPLLLLVVHVSVAQQMLGFVPSLGARVFLDRLELVYLGGYFLLAALLFFLSYRRAPSGVLRQQLKWVTGGTLAGIAPLLFFYIVPYFLRHGVVPAWTKFSVLSLALIPLCFGYAIIRYRLMDVDIIFKRGLAYTTATAGVVALYFAFVALVGEVFHATWATGASGTVLIIVVAALLFQPIREWAQAHLDRFFYRDRLDYRRTLIEFGRTLTNEVRLETMLDAVLDRISQTMLVDRIAVFLAEEESSPRFSLARAMGVRAEPPLDLSFLDPADPAFARGYRFFESARQAPGLTPTQRRTLEQLDLNYFLACRIHDRTVAILGLGKTVDGDFLSSDDLELLQTIAGYVAVAVENARMYRALEQKAEQIERLKDFSENIVESLNVGVLSVDLNDRVESWNTQMESLTGIRRSEALGRTLPEVLPLDLVAEIAARAGEERVSGIYKYPLRGRDGRTMILNVSIAPLVGKTGERLGRLILIEDVSQRVRLEDQMVQTEKLTSLGLLAAGVAHEVNTPLAVISNYIQMLAKQLPSDDPRHTLIEKIVKQTFRASEIVNHLLNFSRTGATEFTEVNLNAVIEETLALVSHPFRSARISVIKNLDPNLPPVLGSVNRLQQVFLNLFLNARDAMPEGGMLEVRTAAQNGTVEVEVTDTGVGIPREHLNRIFDPFFTTKGSGRGTGLGLSVSYGIVKEHAGKIDVRSTPGKGTSFRLEFPVVRKGVHVES
ncbi:MAG: PAS domain S-box protein [Acidobacteriia bacterium]|jgi:PAS domain S-box-containing protein|nr:PAS domain S-box protein [Terriglobia bacterium]